MTGIRKGLRISASRRIAYAGTALLAVLALALAVTGCGKSGRAHSDPNVKTRFISSADEICAEHLQATLRFLGQTQRGSQWRQDATRNEGIYQIIASSIRRLEGLGTAPDPRGDAFRSYVKTLKARASAYRLAEVADLHRDGVFALKMQQRVAEIDSVGDGYAHRYGLRICGIGAKQATQGLGA